MEFIETMQQYELGKLYFKIVSTFWNLYSCLAVLWQKGAENPFLTLTAISQNY